jgi:hypothetical protein
MFSMAMQVPVDALDFQKGLERAILWSEMECFSLLSKLLSMRRVKKETAAFVSLALNGG